MTPEPDSAHTFREIDRALALPKSSAFREFRKLRDELVENRDFRVLDAARDAPLIERLRREGRIYAASVNVVLLSGGAAARIRRALAGRAGTEPGNRDERE
ncbi:MAG TPA: hypothetical protein VFA86_06070 [Gammaproteobacteria bacterium]|nr:hypothetical protein [Gammaproteobacteria bacterium]